MALARWQRTITTGGGIVVPGASVEVRRESDNGLPSLFSDRNAAVAILNPFAADSEGFAAFHVVGGVYKITVTLGSFSRTWRFVGVGTAQEFDVDQLSILYANLPDLLAGQVVGRPLGAGTGDPQGLTAAEQLANAAASGFSLFGPGRVMVVSTTPVNLTAADSGKLITSNNGSRTVNLPAPATGLCFAFLQTGTGTMTVDTPGAEVLILPDGSTASTGSFSVAIGGFGVVVCDGASWMTFAIESAHIPASTTTQGPVVYATAAQYRANTPLRALDNNDVWASADYVALTNAATIAVDMSAGYNFSITVNANQTLGNPSNTKNGQTGAILVTQDGTGSRTLAYSANWDFAAGAAPTLSTAPNARDVLFYQVISATSILITGILKGIA